MSDKNFQRDDYLLLAQLAQQTERFNEMVEFVGKFIQQNGQLTQEERAIVSAAYKNLVGNKRADLRVLTAIEQKESRKQQSQEVTNNLQYIRNYKQKIEKELRLYCSDIINTLDNTLIPKSQDDEFACFYYKMKGDYNRYLAEFLVDDEYNKAVEACQNAYKDANNKAQSLDPTNPIKLGLLLNQSVFYYEILQKTEKDGLAVKTAQEAYQNAIANIDKIKDEHYKDTALIMQLLQDNITLWSTESQIDDQQNIE
ncbi:hypothetical protein ABPG72_006982 [Tetrahymena utriculariae]